MLGSHPKFSASRFPSGLKNYKFDRQVVANENYLHLGKRPASSLGSTAFRPTTAATGKEGRKTMNKSVNLSVKQSKLAVSGWISPQSFNMTNIDIKTRQATAKGGMLESR